MDQEKLDYLQGILNFEKKEIFDENGVKSEIEGFTYAELVEYLEDGEYPHVEILEMFREVLIAHLSAGTAKLALQGGIGDGCEFHIKISDLRDTIQLIKETTELMNLLESSPTT
jgi:hypothetical protein